MSVKIFKSMLPRETSKASETAQMYDFAKKRPSAGRRVAEDEYVRAVDNPAIRLKKMASAGEVRRPPVSSMFRRPDPDS